MGNSTGCSGAYASEARSHPLMPIPGFRFLSGESPRPPVIWPRLATAWTPSPNAGARVAPITNEVAPTTGRDAINPRRMRAGASESPNELGAHIALQSRTTHHGRAAATPLAPPPRWKLHERQSDRHGGWGRTIPFVAERSPQSRESWRLPFAHCDHADGRARTIAPGAEGPPADAVENQ